MIMKRKTKARRALVALGIMRKQKNTPRTLVSWLETINKNLNKNHSLRSTKELAYMFRYMHNVLDVNVQKINESQLDGHCKTCQTYYMLYLEDKNGI